MTIWRWVLYRAVDSAGETIEFILSPKRDLIAAKLFLRLALSGGGSPPLVINVDGHPAYPSAVTELKQSGELGRRCRCRTAPYLNNVIEQDHRVIKKRVTASLGFRSAEGACRRIEGCEAMHAIRQGQIRWVAKGDPVGKRQFIHAIFGVATARRRSPCLQHNPTWESRTPTYRRANRFCVAPHNPTSRQGNSSPIEAIKDRIGPLFRSGRTARGSRRRQGRATIVRDYSSFPCRQYPVLHPKGSRDSTNDLG
jgi:DDE domain